MDNSITPLGMVECFSYLFNFVYISCRLLEGERTTRGKVLQPHLHCKHKIKSQTKELYLNSDGLRVILGSDESVREWVV